MIDGSFFFIEQLREDVLHYVTRELHALLFRDILVYQLLLYRLNVGNNFFVLSDCLFILLVLTFEPNDNLPVTLDFLLVD